METLTRVLARHVYNLDLSTTNGGGSGGAPAPRRRPPRPRPVRWRRGTGAVIDIAMSMAGRLVSAIYNVHL